MLGVFTGHFVRCHARLYGLPAPTMINFFVVTDTATTE
jgi:hypothetical protein